MDILPFWIILFVCMAECVYAKNSCPEVTQQLLKDGFHRDLLIWVNLGIADESIRSCTVAVKVHLPKGLYVDPYELASLQMHNLTEVLVVTDDIDLEVPEYLATEVSVLIYMRPDPECISCFRAILPLHCRYHRPTESDGKISVVLKNPEILIRSQKSFLLMECLKKTVIEAPCSQKDMHSCRWDSMKFKPWKVPVDHCFPNSPGLQHPHQASDLEVSKELKLQIPVGLKHHVTLVCTVTLATTILCSSLLLLGLFKHGCFSFV